MTPQRTQIRELVWKRRRTGPNKKSGITASKLRESQTTRLSYCIIGVAANVPQENCRNCWKNVSCLDNLGSGRVQIRYAVVSFIGFPVHFAFALSQVFRWIFSGAFPSAIQQVRQKRCG